VSCFVYISRNVIIMENKMYTNIRYLSFFISITVISIIRLRSMY